MTNVLRLAASLLISYLAVAFALHQLPIDLWSLDAATRKAAVVTFICVTAALFILMRDWRKQSISGE